MARRMVFSGPVDAPEAGLLDVPGAGRGSYVLAVSCTAGDAVTVGVEDVRAAGPVHLDAMKVSVGEAGSVSVSVRPFARLRLVWDGRFAGTVTLTASR